MIRAAVGLIALGGLLLAIAAIVGLIIAIALAGLPIFVLAVALGWAIITLLRFLG